MWARILISTVFPFLALLTACSAQGGPVDTSYDDPPNRPVEFPYNFFFGAGSASYQIEGAWNVSGKSESIWDVLTHKPGQKSNGDEACKSYEYSVAMSISWPRILPLGFSYKINQEAIDHYKDVLDSLSSKGVRAFVTMYHWDLPQSIQDLGGWTNPLIVTWFTDYARVLLDNFGSRVSLWATINEPALIAKGYESKEFAPGLEAASGIGDYLAAKHIVLAHAQVYHMYYEEYRLKQRGRVGITLSTSYYEGLSNSAEDFQAAKDAYDFEVGMYAHPIFSKEGGFPPRVAELVGAKSKAQGFAKSRLSDFTAEERQFCRGTSDYYGLNHYTTYYVTRKGYKPSNKIISMEDDLGVVKSFKDYPKTEDKNFALIPHGIRGALKYIKENYDDIQIVISENGAAQAALNDTQKIDYLTKYLGNVIGVMSEEIINVFGYSIWSLMDSFEWADGYKPKFGLFKVDFKDPERKRKARLSALWYQNLVNTSTLDPYYRPTYKNIEF